MRRLSALLVLALAGAAVVAAQGGGAARPPERAAGALAVHGRVLGPGAEPLAGARLALLPLEGGSERLERMLAGQEPAPPPAAEAKSAADGSFTVTAPAPGFWLLRVEAAGHLPRERELTPLIEETELPAVTLDADRPLEVEVHGPDGRPLPAAWVAAEADPAGRLAAFRMDDAWQPADRLARRGDAGPARLARGRTERLTVRAWAPGMREAEAEVLPSHASLTLRLAAAAPPRVIEVRDAAGRPVAEALVVAGGRWPLGRTAAGGRLAAALPVADGKQVHAIARDGRQGTARIAAPAPGAAGGAQAAEPANRPAAVISLPAMTTLAGRILESQRREPLPGALVWQAGDYAAAVRTDAAGAYRIAAATGGRTFVSGAAPGYVSSVELVQVTADARGPTLVLAAALRLRGTVVDADTRRPLDGVEVRAAAADLGGRPSLRGFSGTGQMVARTGAGGRFELRGLTYDTPYELHLRRTGYAPGTEPLPPIASAAPGAALPVLALTLDRGRRATGRVLDEEEQPIAGATVTLQRAAPAGDLRGRMPRLLARAAEEPFAATTDAHGVFQIAGLPAGRFDLEARAAGFAPRQVPGLEVPEGQGDHELGTVLLRTGAVLEGRVSDPQGNPIAEAEVRAASGGRGEPIFVLLARGNAEPDAWTGADGWFRVPDLVPGQPVHVAIRRRGFGAADLPGVVPPAEPLAVTLHPALRLSGRVVDPGGEPVAGARIVLTAEWQRGGAMSMRSAGHAESDEEGRFLFEDVEPGTVRLMAFAEGRQPAELGGIAAPPGKDVEGIELVLAPGAVVEGRVLDAAGKPVAGAMVQPVESEMGARMRMSSGGATDGDGLYRIEGLAPGTRSIEAQDGQGRRAVGELEVRPGTNRLDLRFRGGHEIAGRVLDPEGAPAAGAEVALTSAGRMGGEQQTVSGTDGAFRLDDVEDGEYRLLASKEGYARTESDPLRVAGAAVSGIEIRLQAGGALTGRLLGLDADELPRVGVRAMSRGAPFQAQQSGADYEGRYRIPNLGPGEWLVVAEVHGDSGRRAEGQVTLEPGAAEAVLDLEFGGGFTLSGVVTKGGSQLPGVAIEVGGTDVNDRGSATTDAKGSFRVSSLEAGSYEVTAHAGGAAQARTEVKLDGDREVALEIETAAVAGRVVEAGARAPVPGAAVRIELAGSTEPTRWWQPDAGTTDSAGRFRIGEVSAGSWRLRVEREGYGAAERDLEVRAGDDLEDLEITLQPTAGLVLEVVRQAGGAPPAAFIAVLDGAGRTVASGTHQTGEGGRVRLTTVPDGSYEVLAAAPGLALGRRTAAVVPGPVVRLELEPASILELRVPALAAERVTARVTARRADGTPFYNLGWDGALNPETPMRGGQLRLDTLPPGIWEIEVRAADGRMWSASAVVQAGQTTELTLE